MLHSDNIDIQIIVEIDHEEDEVLIQLNVGGCSSCNRLRPLDAWLLLYCLASDWDGWTKEGIAYCETVLATKPTVGLMKAKDYTLLSLPHGHLSIPTRIETLLTNCLKQALADYVDSVGF